MQLKVLTLKKFSKVDEKIQGIIVKGEYILTFIEFCKEEITRILNCMDKEIATGKELKLYIAEKVRIPEGKEQQDHLEHSWGKELLQFWDFAFDKGILTNPFSHPKEFMKDAVSRGTEVILSLSNTVKVNWYKGEDDLMNQKQNIINEIYTIKSIGFDYIF
ncbi:hypothetical protein UP12_19535 (plasmid) [Bacillus pumilus]|uniref:hypothetical protein n=1 Tax=Bacillus pumilus TaxID=1408 RepID=UPI000776A2F3|nr:hypothetical protein [Bacillus pumilus]AMM99598.1 hypothetical protein UP12_19535 [Bacillus pumilus]